MSAGEELGWDDAWWGSLLPEAPPPECPGVYCWWEGPDAPLFVGFADELRRHVLHRELRRDEGGVPKVRAIVRERLRDQESLPPPGPARRKRIDTYLDGCAVAWRPCEAEEAARQADAADAALFSESWHRGTVEDRLLAAYLQGLAPTGWLHTEVPVHLAGGRARHVDAVRFPVVSSATVARFKGADRFRRDLAAATAVELIEVKAVLNRTVIGQLLVGRELFVERWEVPREVAVALTAVVGKSDPGLEPFCVRHGIRVEVIDAGPDDEFDEE